MRKKGSLFSGHYKYFYVVGKLALAWQIILMTSRETMSLYAFICA